jgi:hypothetical protein
LRSRVVQRTSSVLAAVLVIAAWAVGLTIDG